MGAGASTQGVIPESNPGFPVSGWTAEQVGGALARLVPVAFATGTKETVVKYHVDGATLMAYASPDTSNLDDLFDIANVNNQLHRRNIRQAIRHLLDNTDVVNGKVTESETEAAEAAEPEVSKLGSVEAEDSEDRSQALTIEKVKDTKKYQEVSKGETNKMLFMCCSEENKRPEIGMHVTLTQFSGIVWNVTNQEEDGSTRLITLDGQPHGINFDSSFSSHVVRRCGGYWVEWTGETSAVKVDKIIEAASDRTSTQYEHPFSIHNINTYSPVYTCDITQVPIDVVGMLLGIEQRDVILILGTSVCGNCASFRQRVYPKLLKEAERRGVSVVNIEENEENKEVVNLMIAGNWSIRLPYFLVMSRQQSTPRCILSGYSDDIGQFFSDVKPKGLEPSFAEYQEISTGETNNMLFLCRTNKWPAIGMNVTLTQFSGIVWNVTNQEEDGNMRLTTLNGQPHGINFYVGGNDTENILEDGGYWIEWTGPV